MFGSWDNKRAIDYRRKNKIDDSLGTAVNIQAMVFGNKGDDSAPGSPSPATRPTASPPPTATTWSTPRARTWGRIRNTMQLEEMGDVQPRAWEELQGHMQTLERHYRHVRHRVHRRAGQAVAAPDPHRQAHRLRRVDMAHDMLDEG